MSKELREKLKEYYYNFRKISEYFRKTEKQLEKLAEVLFHWRQKAKWSIDFKFVKNFKSNITYILQVI